MRSATTTQIGSAIERKRQRPPDAWQKKCVNRPYDEQTERLFPEDTLVDSVWLPNIQDAIQLDRGSTLWGIEVLRQATAYEAGAKFWPQYVRGLSYLKLGQGAEAGAEFQKIIDHRGEDPLSPLYPLAHLGSARAIALTSDASKSRHAYEAFFGLWKSADSDLPLLKAARKEYDRLRP